MTGPLSETGTQLRPYRRRMSRWWWVRKRTYLTFVLRELSSVFVAWFVVFLLRLVSSVRKGETEYRQFLDWAATPPVMILNVVALLFVTFHAVTWFNVTPQAMAVRLRGRRVPDVVVIGSQYVGWVIVSAFVIWLLVGAG